MCFSQHHINDQLLFQYFYEGLSHMDMNMIDAASGGTLTKKTPIDVESLIATM